MMIRMLLSTAALAAMMSIPANVASAEVVPGPPHGCPGELFAFAARDPYAFPLGSTVSADARIPEGQPGFGDNAQESLEVCEAATEAPE
jgi:hypothetical protein